MLRDGLTASSGEPGSSHGPDFTSRSKLRRTPGEGRAAGALIPHGRPRSELNLRQALFTVSYSCCLDLTRPTRSSKVQNFSSARQPRESWPTDPIF